MAVEPKYPNIEVDLTNSDGNAFVLIGKIRGALKEGGVTSADIDKFTEEATSGDYDNLLQTIMRYVYVA